MIILIMILMIILMIMLMIILMMIKIIIIKMMPMIIELLEQMLPDCRGDHDLCDGLDFDEEDVCEDDLGIMFRDSFLPDHDESDHDA